MIQVNELFNLNFVQLALGLLTAMAGLTAIVAIIATFFDKVLKKPIGFFKMFTNDHKLLEETINAVKTLSEQREEDVKQSIEHDKKIEENLNIFISDVKSSLISTNEEIKNFYDKRVSDREQSYKIQRELSNSISKISVGNANRDTQIEALTIANKEMMATKINEKYKEYIRLEGIPADEVDEFTSLHAAYNGVGGNHHGDAKYNYVMNHLPVIPVETKLITD